ncbi:tripartite tricarboxylate transporter TctB family protein [Marinomonas ostreistagni]|uniref:Tripartite tricarboxylate transporter TctB family protein n=1 Tax=Marinomonas ostreistagni TaxID=359209 RepID=A0ABS0Z9F7_9GAMM|nr:tripartite tricarboxylate transporter TctB family protein [Marinomonas ostreistagni]MBJ7550284.1 tripartite tricarboxylate transporter TctB family protein [Marinomonas ostreistagni]
MSRVLLRHPGEALFSLAVLVGAAYLFWQAFHIADAGSLSSPASLPIAASTIMVISASIIVIKTLRMPLHPELRFSHHIFPPIIALVMALLLIFGLALEPVGFLLSAFCFLLLGFVFLYRGKMLWNIGLAITSLALVYLIFRLIFQVVLPEGIVPEREWLAQLAQWFETQE